MDLYKYMESLVVDPSNLPKTAIYISPLSAISIEISYAFPIVTCLSNDQVGESMGISDRSLSLFKKVLSLPTGAPSAVKLSPSFGTVL